MATTAHPKYAEAVCQGEAHHLGKGKALVREAFIPDRWRDATPMRRGETAHYRHHKFCLTTKRRELVRFRHDQAKQHRELRRRRRAD